MMLLQACQFNLTFQEQHRHQVGSRVEDSCNKGMEGIIPVEKRLSVLLGIKGSGIPVVVLERLEHQVARSNSQKASANDHEGVDDEEENDDEEEGREEEGDSTVKDRLQKEYIEAGCSAEEFLFSPTAAKLAQLGSHRAQNLLREVESTASGTDLIRSYVTAFMKVASVLGSGEEGDSGKFAVNCADSLLSAAFSLAEKENQLSGLTNEIIVNLGLIKAEKDHQVSWPASTTEGAMVLLAELMTKEYVASPAREVLQAFLSQPGSQSPVKSDPNDVPALQLTEEPGPQGGVVQASAEPRLFCFKNDHEGVDDEEENDDEEEGREEEGDSTVKGRLQKEYIEAGCSAEEFLFSPTAAKLAQLGSHRAQNLLREVESTASGTDLIRSYVTAFMKAEKDHQVSWPASTTEGAMVLLAELMTKEYVASPAREVLQAFLSHPGSQSRVKSDPNDVPALQLTDEPGPQGGVVQASEEPGLEEPALEEKQEGRAQGKEAPAQQPETEMEVEALELGNVESVMQLKEEGGVQLKKRRLD
ncbi:uncharacterized protein LOC119160935 isoform X4 [Rhipicephalus microplus]|uniref:uncharacterized protein LOC119160935 isoform X4 n=1 Tax=Rhipicephalus microplus TaxID=6941 RepID=UPI003F6C367E